MKKDTLEDGEGTPLEGGSSAVAHTVGAHYTIATAADAGDAIAADAAEMLRTIEPEYDVPGTHDIVDPASGAVLGPEEAVAVARLENEGNTLCCTKPKS